MGKQDTGAVDALKRTKTEIDVEGKFNFHYVCSEDDFMLNKKIFYQENSRKSNISPKVISKGISPAGKILYGK